MSAPGVALVCRCCRYLRDMLEQLGSSQPDLVGMQLELVGELEQRAIASDRTLFELADEFKLHPNQIGL